MEHSEDTPTVKSSMQACKDMPGRPNTIISQLAVGDQFLSTLCSLGQTRSDIVTGWHVLNKRSAIQRMLAYLPKVNSGEILAKRHLGKSLICSKEKRRDVIQST